MGNPNLLSSAESTLKATSSVFDLFPKIAGSVVGFSALAYIAGWKQTTSYYSELGAPWVAAMLSPSQVMQTSVWLIYTLVIVTFVSVMQLTEGVATDRGLKRWSVILFLIAASLQFFPEIFDNHFSLKIQHICSLSGSFLLVISIGLTVGELIGVLSKGEEFQWDGYTVWLLLFIVIYGFTQAPSITGTNQAKYDGSIETSDLPLVTHVGDIETGWRLSTVVGDKFLLLFPAKTKAERRFKIVSSTDIAEIRTSAKK